MQSDIPSYLMLAFCLALLIKQAFVARKKDAHYLFAIFCASLCMVAIKEISAQSLGPYQYLIGFATCATCNVVWLISRALFRGKQSIGRRHIVMALVIALLVILNQTWHLVTETNSHQWLSYSVMLQLKSALNELTNLLSSCILALSFWEALRNYKTKTERQKYQRVVFAAAFFIGAFTSIVLSKLIFSPEKLIFASPWITSACALLIVFSIQYIIYLQAQSTNSTLQQAHIGELGSEVPSLNEQTNESIDTSIVEGIDTLMKEKQIYLKSSLKICNIAYALNEPEYKISKVIRSHYKAPNFNHFINQYRVEYAKQLLVGEGSITWNILVIGLESGFSSLATFNRAFKALAGDMPSEYRKNNGYLPKTDKPILQHRLKYTQ